MMSAQPTRAPFLSPGTALYRPRTPIKNQYYSLNSSLPSSNRGDTFVGNIQAEDLPTGPTFPKQSARRQEHPRQPTDVDLNRVARTQQRKIGRVRLADSSNSIELEKAGTSICRWNCSHKVPLLVHSVASCKVDLIHLDKTKKIRSRCGPARTLIAGAARIRISPVGAWR